MLELPNSTTTAQNGAGNRSSDARTPRPPSFLLLHQFAAILELPNATTTALNGAGNRPSDARTPRRPPQNVKYVIRPEKKSSITNRLTDL